MKSRQNGLSLVEILVAVTIGMIGIMIITHVYLTSERFNRSTIGEGGAQTNGLIALFSIEREVRSSGYGIADSSVLGCGEVFWYHNPNYSKNITASSPLERIFAAPVFIETDTTSPFTDPDRITVMFGSDAERMVPGQIKSFTAGSNLVDTESKVGFAANDMVLLVGGTGCTLAKVTAVEVDPSQKLQLNPGTPNNPASWGSFPTAYGIGDMIINLGATPHIRRYSIVAGRLRSTDLLALPGGAGTAEVDLTDGIVDLRAQYGKDNGIDNGTVDAAAFAPNDYQLDQFSSTTPANSAEWQQVLSIRVGLLARIGDYEKPNAAGECGATTTAPSWSGGAFSAIDIATTTSPDRCYRYRVFETTVPLRNMIWRAS
jgi:type IV pilus assembly protein PilW